MAIETKEITFEREIEYSLLDHGGYMKGNPRDYNREFAVDTKQLFRFLRESQPTEWAKLCKKHGDDVETGFLKKLYRDLDTHGMLYVLRHGIVDAPAKFSMCFFKPASGMNQTSQALYEKNILSITRQVHYSLKNENSIDVVLFINGLPVATLELKNPATSQTVENAKHQYMKDRDPRELLLSFKSRCLVHFAVDTDEVWMTTKLDGINTYFLPFNKGNNGGKGNPVGSGTHFLFVGRSVAERQLAGYHSAIYPSSGGQKESQKVRNDFPTLSSVGCCSQIGCRCIRAWHRT